MILAKTAVPDLSPVFNLADAVEKAGYDSVWIGDSVTAKSRLEVISTLGALSVKTERVKIGTAVLLAAMRNPVVLAQALASVDVLCGGRLICGVGVSRNDKMFEEEYTACGVPFNQKAGRLSQVLRIMKLLWAGDDVTHENKYYTIENLSLLPKPVQRPGVPLWVSSNDVDSGLKRVAPPRRCLDHQHPVSPGLQGVAEENGRLRQRRRTESRRHPSLPVPHHPHGPGRRKGAYGRGALSWRPTTTRPTSRWPRNSW